MNDIKPLKRFGQNFLQDENILQKIANIIDTSNKNIIEIGPGKGALTKYLISKSKKLIVFEIDKNLSSFLKEKYQTKNFELIEGDFLKADLKNYKNYQIIANIPYNITSLILFKIFQHYENFENVILLVQKEVAQRICAKVGDENYGKLSISTHVFYEGKIMFDVPSKCFFPAPKVTSSVIWLKKKTKSPIQNQEKFLHFIKCCFQMKRKTLANNIKNMGFNIDRFYEFCSQNKISTTARPQELSLEQYLLLFDFI